MIRGGTAKSTLRRTSFWRRSQLPEPTKSRHYSYNLPEVCQVGRTSSALGRRQHCLPSHSYYVGLVGMCGSKSKQSLTHTKRVIFSHPVTVTVKRWSSGKGKDGSSSNSTSASTATSQVTEIVSNVVTQVSKEVAKATPKGKAIPKFPKMEKLPQPLNKAPGSDSTLEWLTANAGVMVLNFGSICLLMAFTRSDILELRLLSIMGSFSNVVYFATSSKKQYLPMVWSGVFVLTNAIMVYKILEERSGSVTLTPLQEAVYEEHFMPHGVTPRQFEYIFGKAKEKWASKDDVLVRRGQDMTKVLLIVSGTTQAQNFGRRVTAASSKPGHQHELSGGDSGAWIGEINFLESISNKISNATTTPKQPESSTEATPAAVATAATATATVAQPITPMNASANNASRKALLTYSAAGPVHYLEWTHEDLELLFGKSVDMRSALTRAMTAAIVGKVVNLTVSKSKQSDVFWTRWLSARTEDDVEVSIIPEEAPQ
eukprot:scaffold421234_cov59-Attheya_sp.AAC.3